MARPDERRVAPGNFYCKRSQTEQRPKRGGSRAKVPFRRTASSWACEGSGVERTRARRWQLTR